MDRMKIVCEIDEWPYLGRIQNWLSRHRHVPALAIEKHDTRDQPRRFWWWLRVSSGVVTAAFSGMRGMGRSLDGRNESFVSLRCRDTNRHEDSYTHSQAQFLHCRAGEIHDKICALSPPQDQDIGLSGSIQKSLLASDLKEVQGLLCDRSIGGE